MASTDAITLVKHAIHNPAEPRHFMRIVESDNTHTARVGDDVIAESASAVIVKEVGHDIYDSVIYFPRGDVDMAKLVKIDKSTHCPLKGDTEYFDIALTDQRCAEAAWSYVEMIDVDGLQELKGMVGFDARQVTVV